MSNWSSLFECWVWSEQYYSWMSHWPGLLSLRQITTHGCHTGLVCWAWDKQLLMDVTLAWFVELETNNYSWMSNWPGLFGLRRIITHGCHTGQACWAWDEQLLIDVTLSLLVEPETNSYSWMSHWPVLLGLRQTITHGCHTCQACWAWDEQLLIMDVTLALLVVSEMNNYSWMSHCPGLLSLRRTITHGCHTGLACWAWDEQ